MTDVDKGDDSKHGAWDDVQAIVMGAFFAAIGIEFFRDGHLGTGGTAGMAFLIHYVTEFGVGPVIFLLNLPFYAFGWVTLGKEFTLKTFAAVGLLALFSYFMHDAFAIGYSQPWFSAIAGGALTGVGMLILFRHKSSLGGIGILAAFVQERLGWRAGKFQLATDLCILAVSFLVLDWWHVALSVLGAVVLNLVLAVNHKPGRYNGY